MAAAVPVPRNVTRDCRIASPGQAQAEGRLSESRVTVTLPGFLVDSVAREAEARDPYSWCRRRLPGPPAAAGPNQPGGPSRRAAGAGARAQAPWALIRESPAATVTR